MLRRALLVAALCSLPALVLASEVSTAERLLFQDAHLHALKPPTSLTYRFTETGPDGARRTDGLELSLKAGPDGQCCAVSARARGTVFGSLPPEIEATGNPVIFYFLERDVRGMQAVTGGQPNYFRRKVRLALAEAAEVRETTVRFGGKALPAQEIRVRPYRGDPRLAAFGGLAEKSYAFVLAEGVPGGIYLIRTAVASPAAETVLTLDEGDR
jgi:hypothetical protein